MRKVIVSEFLTLDGVMQAPGDSDEDREEGFEHGGWQMPYFDEVAGKAVSDTMAVTGGFLLGRRTYEIFAAYWPTATEDGEFADVMNTMPKFVASTTLDEPLEWSNSTLIKGDVAQEVARMKQQSGKDLQVIGSGELVQTLMRHNLVDEYRLMIHPIVVGSGKRLFREGSPRIPLELMDSEISGTGTLILTYRPGATPATDQQRTD